jgi:hypothetical protein
MIARICEFDPKSMLFIEKIERAFPTAEECHSFILSEQGKLNESLQTAFFGVDDSPATADSPPEKTAFRQRLIMYIDQHSCRLARAALRTKPIVVSLECFPVSQFHFSVQFHQSHTIRDVVDFLQRVLQEILNLTLKREIRIFQKESLRQLESHTVLSNIINTGNAFLFTIDDQGPQTTIPLKGAPLSPRQQAEYILVLPGQTFKEEKRRITVTATSTAGEMIEDAANYLRCDVATLRMCVVSEDKYSLVDINPKILIKEIKAPVRICPQFDRAVTIAIVTNPPKYVPTGTVFQLPGAVGKTSELIKGSVAKYYGQQIRTVGVRKNGKLNWSMTAMATEPHAACVAVVGSGLPPTGSGS